MSEKKKDVIEIVPSESEKQKERYLDVDEDAGDFWQDWIEEKKKVVITKALAKEIVRRITAMKIVKLLFERKEPLRKIEIRKELNLDSKLAIHNLSLLMKCGVVVNTSVSLVDRQNKYYQLADYILGEKLVKRFLYRVSFKLADLFEYGYGKIYYVNDLKNNQQFLAVCKKFGLTFEEAVESLKMNHRKLEVVMDHSGKNLAGFKRK